MCVVFFLQRKRSAVSKVKQEAQDILENGEHLLGEANQLSENINKAVEVHKYLELHLSFISFFFLLISYQ